MQVRFFMLFHQKRHDFMLFGENSGKNVKFTAIFLEVGKIFFIFAADKIFIPTQTLNFRHMEQEILKLKLPDTIILEDEYRKCRAAWMMVLGNAQKAFDDLRSDRDVGDSLPEFGKLDAAWIKDFVSKKVDAVMQSPNTYNARIEAVGEWRELEKDLLGKVKHIEKLRKVDPDVRIELMGCKIVISNLEELLKAKSCFVVPEWYKNYYKMVCEAYDRVERLKRYEEKHNVHNCFSTNFLNNWEVVKRPEDFIKGRIWADNMNDFIKQSQKPSKMELEFRQHQREVQRQHEKYQKELQKKHDLLVKDGKQADYSTSVRTIEGKLISVGKHE